jgi:hypothetical protein
LPMAIPPMNAPPIEPPSTTATTSRIIKRFIGLSPYS